MNMGERISEEECNFLVEGNKMKKIVKPWQMEFVGSWCWWWWMYQFWGVCLDDEERRPLQSCGWKLAGQPRKVDRRLPRVSMPKYAFLSNHWDLVSICVIKKGSFQCRQCYMKVWFDHLNSTLLNICLVTFYHVGGKTEIIEPQYFSKYSSRFFFLTEMLHRIGLSIVWYWRWQKNVKSSHPSLPHRWSMTGGP